jgi:cystathionine beta-synthase
MPAARRIDAAPGFDAKEARVRQFPTVTELVGGTPVVRLPHLQPAGGARLLAKLEYLNPGGSIKDRIGLPMIEAAEREGTLRPGGTIVEPTSGNTGVGLAMVAAQRGYRCVFVMPDKMSREKIALLRAFGAEVVVCPTNVEPEDPTSYYSTSRRLAQEIPGAWKPDQYSNPANPAAHEASTGPEIHEQLGDDLDVLVAGVGTGGTITGIARYLRPRLPGLEVVGADPEGSIYSSEVRPYLVEGVGEDFWPATFDPSVVDRYVTISDRDAFRAARRIAREEGILIGGSGGLALEAALRVARELPASKTVLVILPDGGRGYLSKIFDDAWMISHGMLERSGATPTVAQVLRAKSGESEIPAFVAVGSGQRVGEAIDLLQRYGISQMPVVRQPNGDGLDLASVVGSIHERDLLERVFRDADALREEVVTAMAAPLGVVRCDQSVEAVYGDLQDRPAVVVADGARPIGVLTRSDLLEYLAHTR